MSSRDRRILVPVTDDISVAFAEFRRIHNGKSWPESKLYRAFAETGIRVWRHEQASASSIVTVSAPIRSVSAPKEVKSVSHGGDDFPFADIEAAPRSVPVVETIADDDFRFGDA